MNQIVLNRLIEGNADGWRREFQIRDWPFWLGIDEGLMVGARGFACPETQRPAKGTSGLLVLNQMLYLVETYGILLPLSDSC